MANKILFFYLLLQGAVYSPLFWQSTDSLLQLKDDTTKLSLLPGSSDKSISIWRKQYLAGGIAELLVDNRGGKKPGKVSEVL